MTMKASKNSVEDSLAEIDNQIKSKKILIEEATDVFTPIIREIETISELSKSS